MNTIEILQTICKNHELDGDVLNSVFAELQQIIDTQNKIRKINDIKEIIKKDYHKQIRDLDNQISETQKNCTHISTTYYRDPSGGNDSYKKCDICGKEL